jgi:hypothetical protein
MKVYFSNGPTGSYKTIKITSNTLAKEAIKVIAEKSNLTNFGTHLDLVEVKKESRKYRVII